jgi:hypothetical protein
LFVEDRVGGMTIQGTTFYWYTDCGDDFSPLQSRLRSKPSQGSVGPSNQVTLYYPPTCQTDRVASTNVAIDEANIYWLAGDGRIMTLPRNSDGTVAPRELRRTGLRSVGGTAGSRSIAVDGTYLYWNERDRLMRAPKTNSDAATMIYSSPDIRLIRTGGDGSIYFIRGTQLVFLQPLGPFFVPRYIDRNVRDYALDNMRVYWAANAGGTAYIRSQLRGATGSSLLYTADSRTPEIDSLAVDSTSIYLHMRQRAGGGPIFRLPLSGGTATAITPYLSIGTPLLTDGQYLFWTDYNTGIYRLRVNAAPIASPDGNIWITGIEVTQGIQVPNNLVPLVGFKATVVRVYVQSREDSNGPWNDVRAQLSVSGSSGIHGSSVINVSPTGSNPRTRDGSFTFLLNRDETAPGARELTVRIFGAAGRPETNAADNVQTLRVNFGPERHVTLWGYTYGNRNNGDTCTGGAPNDYVPPFSNFDAHRQYLENTYPVSSITIVPLPGSGLTFDNNDYGENRCGAMQRAGEALTRIVAGMPAGSERVYFLLPTQGPGGWCCSFVNGHFIPNGEDERTDPGVTISQETGHSYGGVFWNMHTFDPGFGYPRTDHVAGSDNDGPIGPWIGVELAPTSRLIPGETSDGRPAAWDFMSYHPPGQPFWISPYTYCKLLNYMSEGRVLCPATVEGGGMARGFFAPETFRETARFASFKSFFAHPNASEISGDTQVKQATPPRQTFLYVVGEVSADGSVTLAPFEMIDEDKDLTTKPLGKTYILRLEDAEGKVLAESPFDVSPLHSSPPKGMKHSSIRPRPFNLYAPWYPATARIVILKDKKELAQRVVSPHAPEFSGLTFAVGKSMTGKQNLSWKVIDEDGDQLTYSVWYSRDAGREWIPIAANLNVNALTIDFDQLPGATEALLRVLASDGVNTSQLATQKSFSVPPKGPQITISGPEDGSTINEGQDYLLEGSAFSYEHGAITDSNAFVWQDKVSGKLGTGRWIVLRLSPGEHTISLAVTDASGMAATVYRRLVVKTGVKPGTTLKESVNK